MSGATSRNFIRQHMEVLCSRGMHVGTVDFVQGDQIKLTRRDSEDGKHHLIPISMVASVDAKVHLSLPCEEVRKAWTTD